MKRIQTISRLIRTCISFLLIAWPLFSLAQWTRIVPESLYIDQAVVKTPEGIIDFANPDLQLSSRLLVLLAESIAFLPIYLGLVVLRSLFTKYQKGDIFAFAAIQNFRQIGWLFFIDGVVCQPISCMVEMLAATLNNPPHHRWIIVQFGSLNIEAILGGAVILVISWIMKEAYLLDQERQLTI